MTQEFNLGYTWALNQNTAFEAEYTHVLGLHGNKTINIDQKIPQVEHAALVPWMQPSLPHRCRPAAGKRSR